MSVGPRSDALRSERRRLEFLPWSKWRRPAPRNRTLPVPVILKRLATDFLVLMPLGRRIQVHFLLLERLNQFGGGRLGRGGRRDDCFMIDARELLVQLNDQTLSLFLF